MQQEEFKLWVVSNRGRLTGMAVRLLGNRDDAEDAVQETFLKLWSMREQLAEIRSLEAFSVTVLRNHCLNRLNFRARHPSAGEEATPPGWGESPADQLERSESVERTMRVIDTLPDLQKMILRMKHIEGMEVAEIAEITGSTHKAVRINLSRARRKVKALFFNEHGTK